MSPARRPSVSLINEGERSHRLRSPDAVMDWPSDQQPQPLLQPQLLLQPQPQLLPPQLPPPQQQQITMMMMRIHRQLPPPQPPKPPLLQHIEKYLPI